MKAVIFDLDGTLVNSLEDLMDSTNYAMSKVGVKEINIEQTRQYVGNGADILVKRALGSKNQDKFEKAISVFREYYKDNMCNKTKPYNGVLEVLDTLNKKGYVCGVVSNKPDFATKDMVNKLFGEKIQIAIGADTTKRPKKAAPEGVFLALDTLKIDRKNAVYVGDSEVDVATGKNSNLPVIGVLWGFRTLADLEGADIIIDAPADIVTAVEKLL